MAVVSWDGMLGEKIEITGTDWRSLPYLDFFSIVFKYNTECCFDVEFQYLLI